MNLKKNSASIDFLNDLHLKKETFAFGYFGENQGNQSAQNLNRKKIELLNIDEDENYLNQIKNQTLSSRKSDKKDVLLHQFLGNENPKINTEKKLYNMPPSYYLKQQAQNKPNNMDKKHSISFFEPPKANDSQNKILKRINEENYLNKYILKKYESNKEKTLENIIEEKEKKEKSVYESSENSLKKIMLEKENFTMKVENKNLKKNIEGLKTEIGLLKDKIQEMDLLSDKDRTIGENIDLKKMNELKDKEIEKYKEENQNMFKKIEDLSETNNIISQLNFSLEEKMMKQMKSMENNYMSQIRLLMEEKQNTAAKLEKKEKEIQELSKNFYSKTEEDIRLLLKSHNEFSLSMEKFAKIYRKKSNN